MHPCTSGASPSRRTDVLFEAKSLLNCVIRDFEAWRGLCTYVGEGDACGWMVAMEEEVW